VTLTLEVDGKEFSNFTEASASIALDQFVNTFSFGATSDEPQGFPVRVGDEVRVLADGNPIVTGFVESLNGSHSSNSRIINISGSSKTADVVDSAINQIVFNTPISLKGVIEKILREIGSSLKVTNEVSGLADFEKSELIASKPGQGAFSLMEQYARKRQVFVRTDIGGNILISRNPSIESGLRILSRFKDDDNNVKSARISIDHSARFNKYIVISQQNQTSLFSIGEDPGADNVSNQSGQAIDSDIRTSRTFTFTAENATDNNGLVERAVWEANVRRSRSLTHTAIVVGHSAGNGPWSVNDLVRVIDEWEDVDAVMLIDRLTFRFSGEGSVTEIRCVAPDSYTLQASEPAKQKQTDVLGGLFG